MRLLSNVINFFRVKEKEDLCEHKEWDMDKQIRKIKCRKCGQTAFVKEYKNLFK